MRLFEFNITEMSLSEFKQMLQEHQVTNSDWITELNYDYDNNNIHMTTKAQNVTYVIKNVPESVFDQWVNGKPKGSFWWSHIKGVYTS